MNKNNNKHQIDVNQTEDVETYHLNKNKIKIKYV